MLDQVIIIAGWIGTVSLLAAFWLLTAKRISSTGFAYQILNAAGAFLLAITTAQAQAWSAAVLNAVWFIIASIGLLRDFHSRSSLQPRND